MLVLVSSHCLDIVYSRFGLSRFQFYSRFGLSRIHCICSMYQHDSSSIEIYKLNSNDRKHKQLADILNTSYHRNDNGISRCYLAFRSFIFYWHTLSWLYTVRVHIVVNVVCMWSFCVQSNNSVTKQDSQ
jgi:hypothetical protein